MSRFQLVADHCAIFEVKRPCQIVDVAHSSYYAWQAGTAVRAGRAHADEALAVRIRQVHTMDATYGAPRVTAELNDGAVAGQRVNHKRVARVMREKQTVGVLLRKKASTTTPEPADQVVGDLLERDFTASEPTPRTSATSPTCHAGAGNSSTWPP